MASEDRGLVFLVGLTLACLAAILQIIAFSTPYWWVSSQPEVTKFQKIGLWEACFQGYSHQQDYLSKTFFGCWWIFHREYRNIFDWLVPSWFIAVQVLSTFVLAMQLFSCSALILYFVRCCQSSMERCALTSSAGLMIASGVTQGLAVLLFGVFGDDRIWLPRPDLNYYSWSYGLAVVSGFLALASGFFLLVEVNQTKSREKDVDGAYAMEAMPTKVKG